MPPPNITGKLHLGHGLFASIQDTIIRYKRLRGYDAIWIPGTDHAGIATQEKIFAQYKSEHGPDAQPQREEFIQLAWDWTNQHKDYIKKQLIEMGSGCDWSRERFTGLRKNALFLQVQE